MKQNLMKKLGGNVLEEGECRKEKCQRKESRKNKGDRREAGG